MTWTSPRGVHRASSIGDVEDDGDDAYHAKDKGSVEDAMDISVDVDAVIINNKSTQVVG